jgi:type I restriction enzyme S subunit
MREGWKEVKIGDLGKIVTGNTPPKNDSENYGGKYPFIKPTDMDIGRKYCTNWEENYSDKAFKRYKNSYIPPKSTGVVTIGTVGEKMFQADQWCFTNQSVNVIIPNTDFYDEDFIFYLMKINLPKVENANPGTASGRHHVSKSNFCAIKVRVPESKETQRKIASILSGYDDLIENNLKRIKILEEMAQQTYEEWFVRMRFPGYETAVMNEETGLPEGWERKISSELFKITIGKTPPRGEDEWFNSGEIENRIKWMSISDIRKSNVFLYDTKETLTREAIKKFNFNIIKKGSVALSFKLTVGLVTIASEDMTTNEAIAHFNHGKICNSYTYFYLRNFDYNTLGSTSSIGTAINSKIVKIIPFLKPNIKILNDFDSIVQPILNSINIINNQNQRLRESRDILLPRLMMGMIEV